MTPETADVGSARATLLEALEAYLEAAKAAAAGVIEAQPPPELGEAKGLAVLALLECSSAATSLAAELLAGAQALPAQLLLAPAVQAAIAGALMVPAASAREWAQVARAQTAGLSLPGVRS